MKDVAVSVGVINVAVSVGVRVRVLGGLVFVTVTMTGVGEYMDGVIVGGGAGKVGTV